VNNFLNNIIKYFTKTPRTLFLVDGIGAALTAILLLFVVRTFNDYFGIPKMVLSFLSFAAIILCIYSFVCFLFLKNKWSTFLKIIGYANLVYSIITVVMLCIHFSSLTLVGLTYFLVESTLIIALVYIELRVAAANLQN
jgi:hypothetical protein